MQEKSHEVHVEYGNIQNIKFRLQQITFSS